MSSEVRKLFYIIYFVLFFHYVFNGNE